MARPGRPTIITPEKEAEIAKYFALGLNAVQVASYVGLNVSTMRKYMKRHEGFALKCKQAKLTKIVLANRNEIKALEEGDFRATQSVLLREERKDHHRKMQALRRAEIEARASADGKIVPAIMNLNDAIQEINDAFNERNHVETETDMENEMEALVEIESEDDTQAR